MKLEFKYPRSIDKVFYAPGLHEVPDSLMNHWYLKSLVDCREVLLIVDDTPRPCSGEIVVESATLPEPEVLVPEIKKPKRRGMK